MNCKTARIRAARDFEDIYHHLFDDRERSHERLGELVTAWHEGPWIVDQVLAVWLQRQHALSETQMDALVRSAMLAPLWAIGEAAMERTTPEVLSNLVQALNERPSYALAQGRLQDSYLSVLQDPQKLSSLDAALSAVGEHVPSQEDVATVNRILGYLLAPEQVETLLKFFCSSDMQAAAPRPGNAKMQTFWMHRLMEPDQVGIKILLGNCDVPHLDPDDPAARDLVKTRLHECEPNLPNDWSDDEARAFMAIARDPGFKRLAWWSTPLFSKLLGDCW